jgi:hypothetical protein
VVRNKVRLGDSEGSVQLLPYTADTIDVVMSSRGVWPVECGVADHVLAGLKARLEVL